MSKKLRALIAVLAFITGGLVAFAVVATFYEWHLVFLFLCLLSACGWALAAVEFTQNRSLREAAHVPYAIGVAGIVVLSAAGMFAYVIWAGSGVNAIIVIVWSLVTMLVVLAGTAAVVEPTRRLRRQGKQPTDPPRQS